MSASTLLLSLFQYKAWANVELFAEMEKIDASAHAPERHAAIRLLNHIYVVDRIFAAHLAGTAHQYSGTNTPQTPSLAELTDAVASSDRWYVNYVEATPATKLAERVQFSFTDGAKGTMTREEMLGHVITHGGYHRGAVGRIMTQINVAPPRDLFTIHLHKAEPQRRAYG
jgi:uncharacterized damage-inducible protein DinB